jgi:oligopeptide transport system substrate-binding protein
MIYLHKYLENLRGGHLTMKQSKWLLLVLGLVLAMFLAACGGDKEETDDPGTEDPGTETPGDSEEDPAEEPENTEPKVLNLNGGDEIPSMDPSLVTDEIGITQVDAVYEGLYRIAPGGDIVSGIAIKEETEVSEDGLTWTFHLREDAKWSNGDPVTAHDFVYSWQRVIDPDTASQYGPYFLSGLVVNAEEISAVEEDEDGNTNPVYPDMYGKVEELGVKAVDDYTFEVQLVNPAPYIESFAAFPVFYPLNKEFVESQGDQFALEAANMIFNGPYKMTEWKHGESWQLVKNDTYWDVENVGLDEINFRVVKERSTSVNLYETGEFDRIGVAGDFVDQFKSSPDFGTYKEPVTFYLQFNRKSAEKGEYMNNENFRRALAQGFDKQAFIDVVYGDSSVPANGLIPEDFVKDPDTGEDFREQNGSFLEYDLDAATEAWEAAKEELDFEEVTISFMSGDSEGAKLLTEFFKNEFEKNLPGLELELKNVPFNERLRLQREQEFELVLSGWGPDYMDPMTFMDLFVTDGAYNDGSYSNEDYDALIESAKTELATDLRARWDAMLEAEKILMEEVGIGPVFQSAVSYVSKPYVKNMTPNPFGPNYSYKYITIEGK